MMKCEQKNKPISCSVKQMVLAVMVACSLMACAGGGGGGGGNGSSPNPGTGAGTPGGENPGTGNGNEGGENPGTGNGNEGGENPGTGNGNEGSNSDHNKIKSIWDNAIQSNNQNGQNPAWPKPNGRPVTSQGQMKENGLLANANENTYRQNAANKKNALNGHVVLGIVDGNMNTDKVGGALDYIGWQDLKPGSAVKEDSSTSHSTEVAKLIRAQSQDAHLYASNAILNKEKNIYASSFEASVLLHQYAKAKGDDLKIFNNSWGESFLVEPPLGVEFLDKPEMASVMHQIDQNDLLMVISTGNDGKKEANRTAQVPLLYQEKVLKNGQYAYQSKDKYQDNPINIVDNFLAVTSAKYDRESKSYLWERAANTNACGSAMDWCVMAPGALNEYAASYTSYSTAYVTGVLGNIQQRYPWMSAGNLQQTLLGTADLIGGKVNEETGWGMVNANKAANGYGQFAWDNIEFKLPALWQSEFDNNISGQYGFSKLGQGSLVLNGDNTFTGKGIVNEGELVLNGSNTASFTVNKTGVLSTGDRNIREKESKVYTANHLQNHGQVNVVQANLYLKGDYSQDKGATLWQDLSRTMVVDGIAKLAGKYQVSDQLYVSKQQKTFDTILAGKIEGQFDQFDGGHLLEGQARYGQKNAAGQDIVQVDVKRVSLRNAVQKNEVIAVNGQDQTINHLDNVFDQMDADYLSNGQISANAQSLFNMVSGAQSMNHVLFGLGDSLYKNTNDNLNIERGQMLQGLLNDVQSGSNVWLSSQYSNANTDFAGVSGKKENYSYGVGGKLAMGRGHLFGQLEYLDLAWQDRLSQSIRNKTTTTGYGVNVGYALVLPHDYQIMGVLGMAELKNKAETALHTQAKYDARQYYALLGANSVIAVNKWLFRPEVSLAYSQVRNDDIVHHDLVTIKDSKTSQWTGNVGLTGIYQATDALALNTQLGLSRDFKRNNRLNMHYADYQVHGDGSYLPRSRYSVAMGLNYKPSQAWDVYASYRYTGSNNWRENAAKIGLRYRFK